MLAYNYLSGESITDLTGRTPRYSSAPRRAASSFAKFNAHTFVLVAGHVEDRHGYSRSGKVQLDQLLGMVIFQDRRCRSTHDGGGDECPVSVMETVGEAARRALPCWQPYG